MNQNLNEEDDKWFAAAPVEERTYLKLSSFSNLLYANLAISCVYLFFISRSFLFHKAIASLLCDAGSQRLSPLSNNIKIIHEETHIQAIT